MLVTQAAVPGSHTREEESRVVTSWGPSLLQAVFYNLTLEHMRQTTCTVLLCMVLLYSPNGSPCPTYAHGCQHTEGLSVTSGIRT